MGGNPGKKMWSGGRRTKREGEKGGGRCQWLGRRKDRKYLCDDSSNEGRHKNNRTMGKYPRRVVRTSDWALIKGSRREEGREEQYGYQRGN